METAIGFARDPSIDSELSPANRHPFSDIHMWPHSQPEYEMSEFNFDARRRQLRVVGPPMTSLTDPHCTFCDGVPILVCDDGDDPFCISAKPLRCITYVIACMNMVKRPRCVVTAKSTSEWKQKIRCGSGHSISRCGNGLARGPFI